MLPHRPALFSVTLLSLLSLIGSSTAVETVQPLGRICSYNLARVINWRNFAQARAQAVPVASCAAIPSGYTALPSVGTDGDTSVSLQIGYDNFTHRLCYTATGLPQAPVLRVGVGHTLGISIENTVHDTESAGLANANCPIDSYGGEGICNPKPVFPALPGADGSYFPIMANQAETADGTSNLHVHGLFVSPASCSDEVLNSTIYPANWRGAAGPLASCQSAANRLSYSYQLPADHPAGLYWYHTHRHGQAEHQTEMGLIGAIVVEDAGDVWRRSIGVTDEVLLIGDVPKQGCLIGDTCDIRRSARQINQPAARAAARQAVAATTMKVALDPRIDQANQAGECAQGASDNKGGIELWTLQLNGAAVPESSTGFLPDSELLQKTMQPGQRQIFRLANASANSWVAPQLVLKQNGVETILPLEVFARDGVGIADSTGKRILQNMDVAKTQLVVPPSGRLEFVVHAPPPGGTLYLQSSQVLPGCGGNLYPARRLLVITAKGTAVAAGAADDSDLLQNTPSLAPYLATLTAAPSVQRSFVLAEYGRNFTYPLTHWLKQTPTIGDYDPSQTDFYITEVAASDGSRPQSSIALKPFTHAQPPQVVVHLHGKSSVTEDWLIENSTLEVHAFHIHQVHFRVLGSNGPYPDIGPLLDVVTVPAAPLIGNVATGYPGAPGWVQLRMSFTQADVGEFVFHCHILEHEDNGMMAKIQVVAD